MRTSAASFDPAVGYVVTAPIGGPIASPGALFRVPDRLAPLALFGGSAHAAKNAPRAPAPASRYSLRLATERTLDGVAASGRGEEGFLILRNYGALNRRELDRTP